MTSHNATRNAHDLMWKWTGWQRQRRTCYRVQYHNDAWCSIYECLFELLSTITILHCHFEHNKNTSPPTILEMYVSLACFDRHIFRSKYARRVRPWTLSLLCKWRHWGRGIYLLPLQRHTRETSLSTWLFPEYGGVNIGGGRFKCISFANDMALLAEDERMLKNLLMELNDMWWLWDEDKYK